MKVLVIGATGGSGRAAVETLLSDGHEVTAFSRHAHQLGIESERLRTIAGDATHAAEVHEAVAGQDAVVVALGVNENPLKVRLTGRSSTPIDICSHGTENVIAAMKAHGVRRLVVESAYGVGSTRNKAPWLVRALYRALMPKQLADKERQEQIVRASGLDWVIAQPVALTNREGRGDVLASAKGIVRKASVARRDVGRFLARTAETHDWTGRSVALSGT